MRLLYTSLFSLLLPLVLFRLFWRGVKAPAYRLRWQERLGFYHLPEQKDLIWLHAVSVGEAEAAFVLIKRWQQQQPASQFLVTTTTPTGSARVKAVLADSVLHVYLPYDIPVIVNRFIKHFQPRLAIIMEKEIWPNLYAACHKANIPIILLNARLSARSAQAYLKIPALIKPALHLINQIAVQTDDDKRHFIAIGAKPETVQVLGNIKFDVAISPETIQQGQQLKQSLFAKRFVWIIASSHPGEEEILLNLYPQLRAKIANLLLLIVPRHPERFKQVQALCQQKQLAVVMRSSQPTRLPANTDVYLADSMGELRMLYASADIAFVAGSLAAIGGHNVLEPAAIGIPVLFGSQMFNFQAIADSMLENQAAWQCQDAEAISAAVLKLYQQPELRQALAEKGLAFVQASRGAVESMMALLMAQTKRVG